MGEKTLVESSLCSVVSLFSHHFKIRTIVSNWFGVLQYHGAMYLFIISVWSSLVIFHTKDLCCDDVLVGWLI